MQLATDAYKTQPSSPIPTVPSSSVSSFPDANWRVGHEDSLLTFSYKPVCSFAENNDFPSLTNQSIPFYESSKTLSSNLSYHPACHDNASTYNITGDKQLIYDIQPLIQPFSVIGISGPIALTHSCKFYCLPHFNSLHCGYYSPKITVTLFSLGHLLRNHGHYTSVDSSARLGTDIFAPDHSLLDNPNLAPNNTLPCSNLFLRRNFLASFFSLHYY